MWDPEQRAEIAVHADRLLARGDLLGEWIAVRSRLEGIDGAPAGCERDELRRRAAALRSQLSSRLRIDARTDPLGELARARRHSGLLTHVWLQDATPERVGALLARPDAAFLLRLHLRAQPLALRGCMELILPARAPLAPTIAAPSGHLSHLRHLEFELADAPAIDESVMAQLRAQLRVELDSRAPGVAASFHRLLELRFDDASVPLPPDLDLLERGAWSPATRTAIGRASNSPDPALRELALTRLGPELDAAPELAALVVNSILEETDLRLRAQAVALVTGGRERRAIHALLVDRARERGDRGLLELLKGSL